MNCRTIILVSLICCQLATAQENDPFAELEQEIEKLSPAGQARERAEFEQWKQNYLAEYQKFRQQYFAELDNTRDKLLSTWGEAELSSQSKYVVYDQASNTKTVLDYQNNEIVVSVLHEQNQQVSPDKITQALSKLADSENKNDAAPLQQLTGSPTNAKTVTVLVDKALKNSQSHAATLIQNANQVVEQEISKIEQQSQQQQKHVEVMLDVVDGQQQANTDSNRDEQIIARQKQQIEQEKQARIAKLREQSGKLVNNAAQREALAKKQITTYRIPLAERGDLQKANPFLQQVVRQGKRWQLEPSLLLSIIHTESYFNPKAKSHIPAFGLMQIVPRTAGIDVNRFLFDKDEPMHEEYLFSPEHNIEAGVAYVHILNSRYLKDIENPLSRMYCTIAAYNTGSGNVARTFNPDQSRNIKQAAARINRLTPEQVYQRLVDQLPYEETRHYLNRVTKRKDIYLSIDKI